MDQTDTQLLLRVWNNHDARPHGVLEDVVRAAHPVKLPACTLKLSDQVGAGHVCILHIRSDRHTWDHIQLRLDNFAAGQADMKKAPSR